jgi:predicted transcriptional regulator
VWRELDGELAVRNAASGSTHLLGALASEVLQTMIDANSGFTIGELAARVGKEASTVQEVMTEFERLGLAERTD